MSALHDDYEDIFIILQKENYLFLFLMPDLGEKLH